MCSMTFLWIASCRVTCQNGGTCVDRQTCQCPPGVYGDLCQYRTGEWSKLHSSWWCFFSFFLRSETRKIHSQFLENGDAILMRCYAKHTGKSWNCYVRIHNTDMDNNILCKALLRCLNFIKGCELKNQNRLTYKPLQSTDFVDFFIYSL